MKTIEVQGDVTGQVANQIVNHSFCPGQDACPFDRDEAQRQRRFEQTTGISCSALARKALQHLLDTGAFDYRQLAIAWRNGSLRWDIDSLRLEINVSRWELGYGWFVMGSGFLAFCLGLVGTMFSSRAELGSNTIQASIVIMSLVVVVPFANRYLIKPNQIARRAIPYLEGYYERPS